MTGTTTTAHVHMSNYAQFKDPGQFKKLKAALDHRKEDYNLADTTSATELLEQVVSENNKNEDKAQKLVEEVLEQSEQDVDDLDSEVAMELNLGPINDSEKVEEQPIILKQINQNNKDDAKNQECSDIQSALDDSLLD